MNIPPNWLDTYAITIEQTDKFKENSDHVSFLRIGMFSEAGDIINEFKKKSREKGAYVWSREKLTEEIGDFLWYFIRLASLLTSGDIRAICDSTQVAPQQSNTEELRIFLDFAGLSGKIVDFKSAPEEEIQLLRALWLSINLICEKLKISIQDAATKNTGKIMSRWPTNGNKIYARKFDLGFPEYEQFPKALEVEFQVPTAKTSSVILRINGLNFGDRLTDNIRDPDGYRFHDVFHFAYMAILGWSPVVRSLLKCKRKSSSSTDEGEDGARAIIIEEAISAIVFSYAKELRCLEGISAIDYGILKSVNNYTKGFEVEEIPLWQWEDAIIRGFDIFRQLRKKGSGRLLINNEQRSIKFIC